MCFVALERKALDGISDFTHKIFSELLRLETHGRKRRVGDLELVARRLIARVIEKLSFHGPDQARDHVGQINDALRFIEIRFPNKRLVLALRTTAPSKQEM